MYKTSCPEYRQLRKAALLHRIDFFLYSWADPLFWIGCRRKLSHCDLRTYPREASAKRLVEEFNRLGVLYFLAQLMSALYVLNKLPGFAC